MESQADVAEELEEIVGMSEFGMVRRREMLECENNEMVSGDGEGKCTDDVMFFDIKSGIRFSGEAVVVTVKMKSRAMKRVSDIFLFV